MFYEGVIHATMLFIPPSLSSMDSLEYPLSLPVWSAVGRKGSQQVVLSMDQAVEDVFYLLVVDVKLSDLECVEKLPPPISYFLPAWLGTPDRHLELTTSCAGLCTSLYKTMDSGSVPEIGSTWIISQHKFPTCVMLWQNQTGDLQNGFPLPASVFPSRGDINTLSQKHLTQDWPDERSAGLTCR